MFWSSRASGWPRRLLIVAAAALLPAVAGCEAGDNAPTLNWHYPTDGTGRVTPDLTIRNVFVLGAPGNATLATGQPAGLYFALVTTGNTGDRLLSVQAPGTAGSVTLSGGSLTLPAQQQFLQFTGPQAKAVLSSLTRPLTGGSVVTIVFNFQKAGSVTVRAPVIPNSAAYGTFSPAPTPTPTKTATNTSSPSTHKKKSSATASPSPSTSS